MSESYKEIMAQIATAFPQFVANQKLREAIAYAAFHHRDQKRKYTGEAYIWHPLEVASIFYKLTRAPGHVITDDEVHPFIVAVLHDTVEDTNATFTEIEKNFGEDSALGVWWLSNETPSSKGNRAIRKTIAKEKIASAPFGLQFLKLIDIYVNIKSIFENDKEFAEVYLEEKKAQCSAIVVSPQFQEASLEFPAFFAATDELLSLIDAVFDEAGLNHTEH